MDVNNKSHNNIVQFIALLLVLAVIVCISLFKTQIYQKMNAWNLIPKNETFTELYFDNYEKLPKATVAGKKESFTFIIHNLEGSKMSYPYVVYFIGPNGEKITYAQDSVDLAEGEYKSITVPISFPKTDEKGSVVVLLTQLNQQIDFLLPDTNQ